MQEDAGGGEASENPAMQALRNPETISSGPAPSRGRAAVCTSCPLREKTASEDVTSPLVGRSAQAVSAAAPPPAVSAESASTARRDTTAS